MPLTDAKIRSLKPSSRRQQLKDGKVAGLFLRVQPSGVRSWVLIYRPRGSRTTKTLSLGQYPEMEIGTARSRAKDLRAEVRTGADPRAVVEERKRAERLGRGKRFGELAHAYLKAAKPKLSPETLKGWSGILTRLERHHGAFVGRRASEITRGQARLLLDQVGERTRQAPHATDGQTAVNRTRELCSRVYSWALERDIVAQNPFALLRPERLAPRRVVLEPDQVAAVLVALEELRRAGDVSGYYFELLWLTNVRPQEAERGRWCDVDLQARLWTLTKTKTRIERPVPLSGQAVRLLEQLREFEPGGPYLFPSPRSRSGHVAGAGATFRRERVRQLSGVSSFAAKAIQRTIASLMTEQLGIDWRLADLCKGHLPPKIARTYNRAFWEIKAQRKAFERWGRYLDRLAGRGSGAKVVRI